MSHDIAETAGMSGREAGLQQKDFRPAFQRAAGYLEEILHVMQDSEQGHVSCRFHDPPVVGLSATLPASSSISEHCDSGRTNQSVATSRMSIPAKATANASNEFSFLSHTGSTAQRRAGDSANFTVLSDTSSQERSAVQTPTWPAQTATTLPQTATTLPTSTEFNGFGSTMTLVGGTERITALERALLDALRDEGLTDQDAQRRLHATINRASALPGAHEGRLDHARENAELARCREAMRQQADEIGHLHSQLETSQAQLREREGELALLRQCGRECAELRLQLDDALSQLRDRDAELAKARSDAASAAAAAAVQPQLGVGPAVVADCSSSFPCTGDTAHSCRCSCGSELGQLRSDLQRCGVELVEARSNTEQLSGALRALELRGESDYEDYCHFIKQLAGPVLPKSLSLGTAEILSLGTYGYAFICEDCGSEEKVVVKAQSRRYLDHVVREWAQCSHVGVHPHIAACKQVAMHLDSDHDIICCLEKGMTDGRLVGRRPSLFPESYVCIVGEFMDQGTLQSLMDTQVMTPESMAAVVRQVASALAFLHSRCRTHEDLGPSSVLLKRYPRGDDKLVVKLANAGLAKRSAERQFDHSLLGSLVCCMGIDEPFQHYQDAEEQASALTQHKAAAPVGQSRQLWSSLSDLISRLWRGEVNMAEVECMEILQGHEVRVPLASAKHLEQLSKDSLLRRCTVNRSQRKPADVPSLHLHGFSAAKP